MSTLRDELDVSGSSKSVARAMRLMDILVKALKARGHSIELNYRHTTIKLFNDVTEHFKLRQQTKR